MAFLSLCVVVSLLSPLVKAVALPEVVSALDLMKRAGGAVYSSCKVPNTVALTFDDGPYIYETDISDLLSKHGIKGTFFVNGNNYDCIYDQRQVASLRHAYNAGHMIASHTWSHADLTTLSWGEANSEMGRVDEALSRILGVGNAFIRPPYGNYNELVRSVAHSRNLSIVIWDFDSGDSTGASVGHSEGAYAGVVNGHPDNILALNHETYAATAFQVLPFAIKKLRAAGYDFVTVAECLDMEPYTWVGSHKSRDGSWHC